MSPSTSTNATQALLLLMAIATGVCAGANYFSQPLIHSIQHFYHVSEAHAALTITIAQVAYALGLLFLVPLGDIYNRARLVPVFMFLAAMGLIISFIAPSLMWLWLGTFITALFSVAAQVLIPFATMLVPAEKMGHAVGLLTSGLLIGIYLSTSVSGLLSYYFSWQAIYMLSSLLMLLIAYLLYHHLPRIQQKNPSHYIATLKSMYNILITEKRLRIRSLIGGFSFASIGTILATMAILLSSPPFYLNNLQIGLVPLICILSAISSQQLSKFIDRGFNAALTVLSGIILLASWALFYFSAISGLLIYVLAMGVSQFGLSMLHICNQNVIYRLRPDAKSRINALYMTTSFPGAAFGSALGAWAWVYGGWKITCLVGITFAIVTLMLIGYDQYETRKLSKPQNYPH